MKSDWSIKLEKPVKIDGKTLHTLGELSAAILAMSEDRVTRSWQIVLEPLMEAAKGADQKSLTAAVGLAKMVDRA